MSFQKSVNQYPAKGVPGQIGTLNPATYFPRTALADANGVDVGQGAFFNDTDETATKTGTNNLFAGIVVRNLDHVYYTVTDDGSMTLTEGQAASILTSGDIFVNATEAVSVGDYVYCSTTTAALSFDSTTTAPAGTVATGFRVATAGEADETILITSLGIVTVPAAAASEGGA